MDDPDDAGGKTNHGVAEKREWKNAAKILGISSDVSNIKKISLIQAHYYYYKIRFAKYRINDFLDGNLQKAVLDQSILSPGIINKNLKRALNNLGYDFKVNSGKLSDEQLEAVNIVDKDTFLNRFLDHQQSYYNRISQKGENKKYIKGWTNRVNRLRPNER